MWEILSCLMQILHKLEDRGAEMDRLYDMDEKEIGALIRHPYGGKVGPSEDFPLICVLYSDYQSRTRKEQCSASY